MNLNLVKKKLDGAKISCYKINVVKKKTASELVRWGRTRQKKEKQKFLQEETK